jgi:hypothetical protein
MEMRMAEVIRIDQRLAKQTTRAGEPCEAKILLFTGVRYERWKDADDRPHNRAGSAKRKKH